MVLTLFIIYIMRKIVSIYSHDKYHTSLEKICKPYVVNTNCPQIVGVGAKLCIDRGNRQPNTRLSWDPG